LYSTEESSAVGEITKFWRHIFGEERGLLQIWTGKRVNGEFPEQHVRLSNFNYPNAAGEAAKWALKKSEEGREVYFCSHLLNRPQRIKENAAPVRALWGELDGVPVPNGELRPTGVIASSPSRYHTYWRLDADIPPKIAEDLNKRLAREIGADPSGFDLTQLLRVPNTRNHKYEDCPRVEVVEIREDASFSPRELDDLLPEVEEPGTAPPIGERIPGGIRNTNLASLAGSMRRRGMDEGAILAALKVTNMQRCDPPLAEKEVRKIAASVSRYDPVPEFHTRPVSNKSYDNMTTMTTDLENLVDLPDPVGFPLEALPPSTRRFVEEGAASIGCPVDFVGISVLAALSAAIGDTRRIVLKKKWIESPAIYAMLVGPPGSKKTPATKLALEPVRERQIKLRAEYERQKEEYKSKLAEHKKAAKGSPTEGNEPKKPTLGRTWVDDTTVERLADILEENQRGIIVIKDELSGWLASHNQYKSGGKGSDRQFWLSAHDNTATSVDRKSLEEPKIISRPFVVLLGGIQPARLPDFGKDQGDGLIERFTPVYPHPVVNDWVEDEVSDEADASYKETINTLYRLEYAEYDGDCFPSKVRLAPEAKALFVAEYNKLSREAQMPGFPQRLQPAWSKLEGRLARIALVISMTRIAELKNRGTVLGAEYVTEEDMHSAIMLLDYFKNHIRRLYTGLYSDNPRDRLAEDLRDFLVNEGSLWEGTASELYEVLPSEHKPERVKDFGKAIRAIAKQSALLELEDLPRTDTRRAFRLALGRKL
jgi:hypothetical protein